MTKKELREQMEVLRRARKAKLLKKYQDLAKDERRKWEIANPKKTEIMSKYAAAMVNLDVLNTMLITSCSDIIPGHRLCSPIDPYRQAWSFTAYTSNDELKKIAKDFKQEDHNIDHEFNKLEDIIANVSAGKAFRMLVAAGLPFTENKAANLVALQAAQLNKSLII